jgi:hypothetical protein
MLNAVAPPPSLESLLEDRKVLNTNGVFLEFETKRKVVFEK